MRFRYQSGDEILAGDRIRYASEDGVIDLVTDPENPDHTWYIEQCAGGCMMLTPSYGRVFVSDPHEDEDLEFVSRDVSASG